VGKMGFTSLHKHKTGKMGFILSRYQTGANGFYVRASPTLTVRSNCNGVLTKPRAERQKKQDQPMYWTQSKNSAHNLEHAFYAKGGSQPRREHSALQQNAMEVNKIQRLSRHREQGCHLYINITSIQRITLSSNICRNHRQSTATVTIFNQVLQCSISPRCQAMYQGKGRNRPIFIGRG
jgi:hypothetical protein